MCNIRREETSSMSEIRLRNIDLLHHSILDEGLEAAAVGMEQVKNVFEVYLSLLLLKTAPILFIVNPVQKLTTSNTIERL